MKRLVDRLKTERMLPGDGFAELLTCLDKEAVGYLYESAVKTRLSAYGRRHIYTRLNRVYKTTAKTTAIIAG